MDYKFCVPRWRFSRLLIDWACNLWELFPNLGQHMDNILSFCVPRWRVSRLLIGWALNLWELCPVCGNTRSTESDPQHSATQIPTRPATRRDVSLRGPRITPGCPYITPGCLRITLGHPRITPGHPRNTRQHTRNTRRRPSNRPVTTLEGSYDTTKRPATRLEASRDI